MNEFSFSPDSILARYALDAPHVAGRVSQGFVNENLIVEDRDGRRYLLRGYRRLTDQTRLEFQLNFQRHLMDVGIPAAPIVASAAGDQFVFAQGIFWVLFGWVEGTGYDFDDLSQTQAAARTLARFHLGGGHFETAHAPPPQVGAGSFWFQRLETATQQSRLLAALFPEADLRDDIEFSQRWWDQFAGTWTKERVADLPRTWLHSDYHGGNVAFAGHNLVCLFDFDDIWFGPRVCDIGQGLFNFGRRTRGIARTEGREMRAAFAKAFLDSYATQSPLTAEEHAAVAAMAKAVYPPNAFQLQWMKEHGLDYRRRFRRDVEITRQVEQEMDKIAPALGWPTG